MQTLRISSPNVQAIRYGRGSGEVLDWHEHRNLSLCFVIQGEYEETVRNETFTCRSGDVVIQAAGVRHLNKFGPRGGMGLLLEISDAFLKNSSAFTEPALTGRVQDHQLARIGLELNEELQVADRLSPFMLESIAIRSIVLAFRLGEAESKRRAGLDAREQLLNSLEELTAKCLNTSERQNVRRIFREANGHSYGLKRRAFRALDELLNSEHSLADIAAGTGFYDQAHFTKVFSKFFGVTPGRLRSRIG